MQKVKALVLFSGGLDSILAVKILELQNIEVTGLCFTSNFFNCETAKKSASENNINLKTVDISKDILDLVKNPPSGYGKNLNPCIDCHSLMIKKANDIMKNKGYNFIATGEVLGQRPFSQNKIALERVKKISGVDVLRPLSAKLLPETAAEKNGLVNRGRLLNISGRTRERQMELAEKYKVTYPSPAGGCLLTDPDFSGRLMKLLDYWPDCSALDVELLKNGRVYWSAGEEKNKRALIIIGREQAENERLAKLARPEDILIEVKDIAGPTTLIRIPHFQFFAKPCIIEVDITSNFPAKELGALEGSDYDKILHCAALLTGYYTVKARGKKVQILIKNLK